MTEDQIERHVEKCMDRYDAGFIAGRTSQAGYDLLIRELNKWADDQYRIAARVRLVGVGR
jgi:hypothetical protein